MFWRTVEQCTAVADRRTRSIYLQICLGYNTLHRNTLCDRNTCNATKRRRAISVSLLLERIDVAGVSSKCQRTHRPSERRPCLHLKNLLEDSRRFLHLKNLLEDPQSVMFCRRASAAKITRRDRSNLNLLQIYDWDKHAKCSIDDLRDLIELSIDFSRSLVWMTMLLAKAAFSA